MTKGRKKLSGPRGQKRSLETRIKTSQTLKLRWKQRKGEL